MALGPSIPVSTIVSINPSVISAGGSPLSLNGLLLSAASRVPFGTVQSFPTPQAVSAYFGAASPEAAAAAIYFAGFDNSNIKPGSLLMAQYAWAAPIAAYCRGASLAAVSLAALQAFTGLLTVTMNGTPYTSSAINLAGATSFSSAAQLVNAALGATGAANFAGTGAVAAATAVLNVTAVTSGAITLGAVIAGTNITAGSYIAGFLTGTGGIGTYTLSVAQTAASAAITGTAAVVSFDTIASAFVLTSATTGPASTMSAGSGTIAASLGLTAATGAVLSPGAAISTPAAFMASMVAQTTNWATFATLFQPVTADKTSFAQWNSQQNNRYAYIAFDTDVTVTAVNPTASAGYAIIQAGYGGTFLLYEPVDVYQAVMVQGFVASVDYTQLNGRADMAFRAQSGMAPGVTSQTIATQLIANGYNYYGAYATATTGYNFLFNGAVTGPFAWLDSYIDQIQLNNAFQAALMSLLVSVRSIPYNDAGYNLLRAALADPITAALNSGIIRGGVALSAAQIAQVNAAAGLPIDSYLSTRGWYLQILPAAANTRVARGSPPCTFWYADGQSIQAVNLGSVEVQ